LLEDGKRTFWREIKRIHGNKAVSSKTVDGLTDAGDIAQLFAARYRDLYTSVPYNIDEMQVILNGIDSSLTGMSVSKDSIFSVSEVEDAVSRHKPHKSDGSSELATDHFINGGRDCLALVAFILTAITVYRLVPDIFRRSMIVPNPKGHNVNKSNSANFKGIALSSIFGKILDIILDRYHVQLMSCDR